MNAVEQVTVTIPATLVDCMRSSIAAGEYADMGDLVESALLNWVLAGNGPFGPVDHEYIRREVHAAMEEYDRDPSTGSTADEVRRYLEERRASRQREAA